MADQPELGPNNGSHEVDGSENHPPTTGVSYFIKVDGKTLTFDHRKVKGRAILRAANLQPVEDYDLYLKQADGGRRLVDLDDVVDLQNDGIEKFHSIPKKRTDGRSGFAPLTAEDIQFLDTTKMKWSVSSWQGNVLLKICGWRVPPGYTVDSVDVALVIPITYPTAQIDMFYFSPSLQKLSGVQINATGDQDFNGEIWQRWSRHRTQESAWRPGTDDIGTHIGLMDACIREELGR